MNKAMEIQKLENAIRNLVIQDFASNSYPNNSSSRMCKRAAIYIRKSRIEIGATHYSPERQEEQCRAYAKSQGWEIVAVLSDLDKSGRNAKRDGFLELLDLVRKQKVDVIVVPYLDRVYRNKFSLPKLLEFLNRHNVDLVSVNEGFNLNTLVGHLLVLVLGVINEWPLWTASTRTRSAKFARARSGITNASYRFGYCYGRCSRCNDPNGKDYCPLYGGPDRTQYDGNRLLMVPHPIEKYAVLYIVHLYHKGWSDRDIADHLNQNAFTLPTGQVVQFRTKGRPSSEKDKGCPPGPFSRDNIREIVTRLFYVGLVTYAESAPLEMKDDLEHPERIPGKKHHPRRPTQIFNGLHEAIYPYSLWEENQKIRLAKNRVPRNRNNPTRSYLLSNGVGFCWECYQHGMHNVKLRGSTSGNGKHSYRCATLHDGYKVRKKRPLEGVPADSFPILPAGATDFSQLVAAHSRHALPAADLESQAEDLIKKLVLSQEMRELIMAYYFSDNGMDDYIIKRRNVYLFMEQVKSQHRYGLIDEEELTRHLMDAQSQLRKYSFTAHPEAYKIRPLLEDFSSIWEKLTPPEKHNILKQVFSALYFDRHGRLVQYRAYSPFDKMIQG